MSDNPDISDYSTESIERNILDILFSSNDSTLSLNDYDEDKLLSILDYDGIKRYRADIYELGKHSNSDNNRLLKSYTHCPDSKVFDLLVEGNLHIVARLAMFFSEAYPQIDEQDLISEGYFGLEKAINTYNVRFNSSFAAYASLSILRAMQRYIATGIDVVRHPLGWHNRTVMFSKYLEEKGIDDVGLLTKEDRIDICKKFKLSERSLSQFLSTYPHSEFPLNTPCISDSGKTNSLLTFIISSSFCFHPYDLSFIFDESPKYRALLSSRDILYYPQIELKSIICDILEDEVFPLSLHEIMDSLKTRCPFCVFSKEQIENALRSPLFYPITKNETTYWIYRDFAPDKIESSLSSNQDTHIDYNEFTLTTLYSLLEKETDDSNTDTEEGIEDSRNNLNGNEVVSDIEESNNDDIIKMIFG